MCEDWPSSPTWRPHALARLEREFIRPHRGAILWALAVVLLGSLLLLPVPLVQGWALDQLVSGADSTNQAATVVVAFLFSVFCYLARMGLVWRGNSLMSRVSLEVVRDLTDAIHRKYQRLPLAYFDREP